MIVRFRRGSFLASNRVAMSAAKTSCGVGERGKDGVPRVSQPSNYSITKLQSAHATLFHSQWSISSAEVKLACQEALCKKVVLLLKSKSFQAAKEILRGPNGLAIISYDREHLNGSVLYWAAIANSPETGVA